MTVTLEQSSWAHRTMLALEKVLGRFTDEKSASVQLVLLDGEQITNQGDYHNGLLCSCNDKFTASMTRTELIEFIGMMDLHLSRNHE